MFPDEQGGRRDAGEWGAGRERGAQLVTPGSHSKISRTKIFAKGWVAQKPFFFIGSGVIFSKGSVRKDENLRTRIGCRPPGLRAWLKASRAPRPPEAKAWKHSRSTFQRSAPFSLR